MPDCDSIVWYILSDPEVARFSGEGYIYYDLSTLNPPPSTTEDLIKLRFKASNQNGVLLYADGNQGDFVALQLHRGNLLFSIDLGKFPLFSTLHVYITVCSYKLLKFQMNPLIGEFFVKGRNK